MTWEVRNVDPARCLYCDPGVEPGPGPNHGRVLNLPDRPHPRRARPIHCADCDRHIGKRRFHVVVVIDAATVVLCVRCWERRGCPPCAFASRAAAPLIDASDIGTEVRQRRDP